MTERLKPAEPTIHHFTLRTQCTEGERELFINAAEQSRLKVSTRSPGEKLYTKINEDGSGCEINVLDGCVGIVMETNDVIHDSTNFRAVLRSLRSSSKKNN